MAVGARSSTTPNWNTAFAIAATGHLVLAAGIALQRSEIAPRVPDPVMVVELPSGIAPAAPEPIASQEEVSQPEQDLQAPLPRMADRRIEIPEVDVPLSANPVVVPAPRPAPRLTRQLPRSAPPARNMAPPPAAVPPPAATAGTGDTGSGTGDDPRVKEARDGWYALIFADLARKKRYPREARQAGQEGTPTVRFTVDRRGRVSNVSITRSSGHDLLDDATIELIRRASPLPAMPRGMGRDNVTMSLPIEYELDRD